MQAVDGFLLIVAADGTVQYVSENIVQSLGFSQVWCYFPQFQIWYCMKLNTNWDIILLNPLWQSDAIRRTLL